jgi:hypothetical protein
VDRERFQSGGQKSDVRMSNCKDPHDFEFLDESEWRILYLEHNNQENVVFLGKDNDPPAKITFGPDDLKVLIFPDPKTREMALNDDDIFGWFGRKFPIMTTVEECLNF